MPSPPPPAAAYPAPGSSGPGHPDPAGADADADRCWEVCADGPLERLEVHLPALERAGLLGAVEVDGRAVAYVTRPTDEVRALGRVREVEPVDWLARWREGLEPVVVGGLTVAAPWHAGADPRDAATVVIDPGRAFGTGHHETTAGCLAALQERRVAGARVLDVGTGSGVLAVAAAKLGAAEVVACDVDPAAVAAAGRAAADAGVAVRVVDGSPERLEGRFDLVLANLDTATLCELAGTLAGALADHGELVASGTSTQRADRVVAALQDAGLVVLRRDGREWAVLLARRAG